MNKELEKLKENLMFLDIKYYKDIINYISKLQKELEQEKEKHKSTIYNFELTVDKLDKIKELIDKRNKGIGYTSLDCVQDIEDFLKEN